MTKFQLNFCLSQTQVVQSRIRSEYWKSFCGFKITPWNLVKCSNIYLSIVRYDYKRMITDIYCVLFFVSAIRLDKAGLASPSWWTHYAERILRDSFRLGASISNLAEKWCPWRRLAQLCSKCLSSWVIPLHYSFFHFSNNKLIIFKVFIHFSFCSICLPS